MQKVEGIYETDSNLAFLPFHHIFGSTALIMMLACGVRTSFPDGLRYIAQNLKEYEVSVFVGVPLLVEAIYNKILKEIEKQGKTKLINNAIKISNALLKIKIDIRRLLFKQVLEQLGGKLRFVISGGAPLDPKVQKGWNDLGIKMVQGYGLTESSPVIAVEDDKYKKIGSIGKALPTLDVKIDEPNEEGIGELMAKGPSIMLGYYENEEATKAALDDDGWFHTGDLARQDKDGYFFITGRMKNVIVLKNGKNIYPEEIESYLNESPLISESLVIGTHKENDDETYVNAQIFPNKEAITEYLKGTVPTKEEIKKVISDVIANVNSKIPNYKHIKDFAIRDSEFEKTTTQKVKRYGNNMKIDK